MLESKSFSYTSDELIYTSPEGFAFLRQYDELMMSWDLRDKNVKAPINVLTREDSLVR